MAEKTRILMLEDTPADAELAERTLRRAGLTYESRRVETRADFVAALREFRPDVILADYTLPSFTGLEALSLTYELSPLTPVLIVTGSLSEETAADCIKAGAVDYILKERLTRLPSAVGAALEHRRVVAEKARAEEELRASERKYRALFTESRDGIFIADAATRRVLDANPSMIVMSGYRLEQLQGTTLLSFLSPDQAAAAGVAWEATARGGTMGAMELDFIRADGSRLPVEVRASAYTGADGAVRLFGIVRDVTERRQRDSALRASEQRHRALFEEARDAIFIADPATGLLLDVNRAGREMVGADLAALRRMHQAELHPPEERESARSTFAREAHSVEHHAAQFHVLGRDGHRTPVEITGTLMIDETGRPLLVGVFRDVTKRLAAETDARESAERFRVVVESAPDAVLIHTDGIIRYVNAAAVRMYGAGSAEAMVGMPMLAFVGDAFRDVVSRRIADITAGRGDAATMEETLLRLDGSPFLAEVNAVRFPQGGKTSVLVYARDVTTRVAAEQALRESEVRFRQVVEGGPEAIFTSRDMRFTYLNPAALTLLGAESADQLVGRPTTDVISPAFHEFVRRRTSDMLAGGAASPSAEEVFLRRDGTPIDVEVRSVPFPQAGGRGVLTFFRDITERRRTTKQLALLSTALTQAGEIALITDTNGDIEYVNPAFERVTGYSAAEVLGHNPRLLKSGIQGPGVYREMWDTLTAGRVFSGVFVNRKKNGDHYVAEVVVSPVRDASGTVVQYVGLQRDVTREHDLEEQLRQSQKMEAVGQLTGGIAHDFNNLLGIILTNSSLLGAALRGQDPELWSYLADIEQAAEAGRGMVKKLLAFGRRERLTATPLDLGKALHDLESTLRRFLPETFTIRTDLPASAPSALVDAGALEQMVLNLATNARDAMAANGTLSIGLTEVEFKEADAIVLEGMDRPGRYACLAVSDTGAGMDAATLERAFEPFFTTKPPGAGTGLGLPMVFGLMKQHGGFVRLYSEPGEGTTVRLYFPVVAAKRSGRVTPTAPVGASRGSETILVVEDQPMLRRATARALEKLGYEILVACDGQEGLATFAQHRDRIRLVLSDRVMPELGGVELYERLRAEGHQVPFLLMSGYAADAGGITPVPKGLPVLEKPWTVEALAGKMRELLDAASRA